MGLLQLEIIHMHFEIFRNTILCLSYSNSWQGKKGQRRMTEIENTYSLPSGRHFSSFFRSVLLFRGPDEFAASIVDRHTADTAMLLISPPHPLISRDATSRRATVEFSTLPTTYRRWPRPRPYLETRHSFVGSKASVAVSSSTPRAKCRPCRRGWSAISWANGAAATRFAPVSCVASITSGIRSWTRYAVRLKRNEKNLLL